MLEEEKMHDAMSYHSKWVLSRFVLLPLFCWFAVLLTPIAGSLARASDVNSNTARCGATDQVYLYYSPDTGKDKDKDKDKDENMKGDRRLPAVMLLHGAGDRPENMVDDWKSFARKEKIVLLAPELPRDPKFEDVAPAVFRCVVEDARHFLGIDAQRVYLFGNSMGGYLAFDAAMFESQYFAAVAVHANRIADEYTGIVARAQRKTPIAIYIGDHDQFFPVGSVRKTRDLLLKSGFPVHYVELVNHDHNYYARSDEINSDVWKFFRKYSLPLP
jgi:poly(3-hydroxybutyrate) depolymerase